MPRKKTLKEVIGKFIEVHGDKGVNILYFSNKQYEDNIIIDENKLLEKIIKK